MANQVTQENIKERSFTGWLGRGNRAVVSGARKAGRAKTCGMVTRLHKLIGGLAMASTTAVLRAEPIQLPRRFLAMLPGIGLLTIVGLAGKVLEKSIATYTKAHHLVVPNIEYVLWAILIGLLISNTVGVAEVFKPGIATYEFWLKTGIVLLGARFLLADVLKLGAVSLTLVLIELVLSIGFMTLLGRIFKLSPKLTSLLAVGSSICGVSAIIATKGPSRRMTKTLHSRLRRSWLWARWRYLLSHQSDTGWE